MFFSSSIIDVVCYSFLLLSEYSEFSEYSELSEMQPHPSQELAPYGEVRATVDFLTESQGGGGHLTDGLLHRGMLMDVFSLAVGSGHVEANHVEGELSELEGSHRLHLFLAFQHPVERGTVVAEVSSCFSLACPPKRKYSLSRGSKLANTRQLPFCLRTMPVWA